MNLNNKILNSISKNIESAKKTIDPTYRPIKIKSGRPIKTRISPTGYTYFQLRKLAKRANIDLKGVRSSAQLEKRMTE